MNAGDAVRAQPWAIERSYLALIADIADRCSESVEAVEARLGMRLENTRAVTVRDGVAAIPVVGPIFRRASIFTRISGATSVQDLATDFTAALDNPNVRAILLSVDSPGGTVEGINELAGMIAAARGRKPIVAYVDGMAASGAYWLASAADRIVADATARLGSIGVVMSIRDTRERDAREGTRTIEIVSSQSPGKRLDPQTDEGRAAAQVMVDDLAGVFVAAVAGNRGVALDKVLSDFGRGEMMIAEKAITAGMADSIGSYESLLAELAAASTAGRTTRKAAAAAATEDKRMSTTAQANEQPAAAAAEQPAITAETIAAVYPAIAQHFRAEGAAAERARITGIQALALPGQEALVAALIADGKTTPEQAAVAIVGAEQRAGRVQLGAMLADGAAIAAAVPAAPAPQPDASAATLAAMPLEHRCQAEWEKDPALRAEFGDSLARYTAFKKAEASGRARILRRAS